MSRNCMLRYSLALPLLAIAACGPSPELVDATAAMKASAARATDAEAVRDMLQVQARDLKEAVDRWHRKIDEAESTLAETQAQVASLASRMPGFVRATVSRGNHESVSDDVVQLLLQEIAEVLDPATLGAKAIRAAAKASGSNGPVFPQRLSSESEQIVKSIINDALQEDRELQRRTQMAVREAGERVEMLLEAIRIVRPFEPARVLTVGDAHVVDPSQDVCEFRTKVVYFERANGELEMANNRWHTFLVRKETLESQYVKLSYDRYTGTAEIDCYLLQGGSFVEQGFIDQLRSSIPTAPELAWPSLEVAKILLTETASTLAVGEALRKRADGTAIEEPEGRRQRVDAAIDALIALHEARHQAMVERVRLEVERVTSDVPEELLDMLEAAVVEASPSKGSGVDSIADAYSNQTWAENDRIRTLTAEYRDLLQQLADGVVQKLQEDFDVYTQENEQLGSRLMAWQGGLELESVRASESQIPALTRELPRPVEPSHVSDEAIGSILVVAGQSTTIKNALDVVKAESRQLATVAEGAFQAADRALLDYLDSGMEKAKVEGLRAADFAGEDDPSQGVPPPRYEGRDDFESFLRGMDWYPTVGTRFHDAGREGRAAARVRIAQSIASLEAIRDGLGPERPNTGFEGALEALRATQEALRGLDELASPEQISNRLAEGRSAARRAFLVSSMGSYFERTSSRWSLAQARLTESLDNEIQGLAEPGDVIGMLKQAHAAGSGYFREVSREGAADWPPSDDLLPALVDSSLEESWATHISELRSLADRLTTDLDEYFDNWSSRLIGFCADRFAPVAIVDSTALTWWEEASRNAGSTGATTEPPLLKAVQVAPCGAGSLLVCTWPLKGLARRSGLREMSVLYHLRSDGSIMQLKLTQGPLAVVSNGSDEFEVVDLSGVEEWSGESRPKRGRRYSSSYRPEEGAVIYDSLDQRDNSANRRVGGPMTPRMVSALKAVGIPTYKERGAAWTDADLASMLIRESWSRLPALEIGRLEGEGQFALETFGSRTRLGAVHLQIGGADPTGFLYTLRAPDEPMAVISDHLKPRERFEIKWLKVRNLAIFLGSGSVIVARSDGQLTPLSPLSTTDPGSLPDDPGGLSEEEAREIFEPLLQMHCFTSSGAHRDLGRGVVDPLASMLEQSRDADPRVFSALAGHCKTFADSPELFIPAKATWSYRNHLENGIQQLAIFIRELDREGGQ
jgi:hypothetical protein